MEVSEKKSYKPSLKVIQGFQRELLKFPQQEIETHHHFSKGIYAREIRVPGDTILVGKIHKTEHLNVLSQGKIVVLTENGLQEIVAPCTFVSPPGTKRIGYTLSDVIWTTVHGDVPETKDLDNLEDLLIEKEDISIMEIEEAIKCLG